jgi:hypothetical protein
VLPVTPVLLGRSMPLFGVAQADLRCIEATTARARSICATKVW